MNREIGREDDARGCFSTTNSLTFSFFTSFILHSAGEGPSEEALERQGQHPSYGAIHAGRGRVRTGFLFSLPPSLAISHICPSFFFGGNK